MIPTIHLPRKSVKHFKLEDKELFMSLDARAIQHFQKANKKGFLKILEELQSAEKAGEAPIYELLQLLASCVKYPTGQPVGMKFFKDYDDLVIVEVFIPMLLELYGDNLPKAKDEAEKK